MEIGFSTGFSPLKVTWPEIVPAGSTAGAGLGAGAGAVTDLAGSGAGALEHPVNQNMAANPNQQQLRIRTPL
jgi:hypothetical protein